jgi:F-type H+-transporting ATPase subunit delta
MASVDDRHFAVARLYAKAMLEVAEEQGAAESLQEELEGLAAYLEGDADFADFLTSPLIDRRRRRDSLERLLRGHASDLLVDSLQVINAKGRLELFPTLVEAYRRELLALRGYVDVHVTTAVGLSDALRQRLRAAADKFTGRKARLVETVDPQILGGLVVRVENEKFDASIARALARLTTALDAHATREILTSRALTAE